jgi:hypothetical protein
MFHHYGTIKSPPGSVRAARGFFNSSQGAAVDRTYVIVVVKKTLRYSKVFSYNRTPVHAFIPQFRISEHYYGKRYNF